MWIKCFLTNRLQYVKFKDHYSNVMVVNTGAPQGCVLSAVLFTLYTYDCQSNNEKCILLKYADDTVIVGLLDKNNDETGMYFDCIDRFHQWCDTNFLDLNVSKTKEMIIDFSKNIFSGKPVYIENKKVEIVNEYKYLGITIDNKLKGSVHVSTVFKKANQRLYFLRKLKSLNIDNRILNLFYRSVIESVLSFCIIAWYGNLDNCNKKKLNRIVKRAGNLGCDDTISLTNAYKDQVMKKFTKIINNNSHNLNKMYMLLPSALRYDSIFCRTNRYKFSFVPTSIRLFNGSKL